MDNYVKVSRHEGQYVAYCLPPKRHVRGGCLLPQIFREKDALTAFLRHTLHIPQAAIEKALQRGESIRISSEQVSRWPR
jgi:hypothetical protein